MSPFKISFSKLLRSTAMTLLFIPGVSAMMQGDWEDWEHLKAGTSSSGSRASTSSSSTSFTESEVNFFGQIYKIGRFNVDNTEQYRLNIPQAPVVHTYNMEENDRNHLGNPVFSYAARQSAGELDPNLFPALSGVQATLLSLGIDPEAADYFYVVQDDPWNAGARRLLRPQSWAFPDAPYSIDEPHNDNAVIKVAISSPNNSIELTGPSEGKISSHNGISSTKPNGSSVVVSSGPSFPMLSGLREDQTSFFVSTVVIPSTKRAAVTFHTILSDADFDLLQITAIKDLRDLQYWLVKLFQSKYGATSDSSSPYSSWTTSAGPSAPVSTLASSSTPAPVVPALELDTREFHMGKRNDYPSSGFSVFEGTHRWTLGEKASITLPLAEMGFPSGISFLNTGGLVTASHPQKLTVKMNGKIVGHYVYKLGDNKQTIDIRLPQDGSATIEFETLDAISPLKLGISADKRELGILFREVKLQY